MKKVFGRREIELKADNVKITSANFTVNGAPVIPGDSQAATIVTATPTATGGGSVSAFGCVPDGTPMTLRLVLYKSGNVVTCQFPVIAAAFTGTVTSVQASALIPSGFRPLAPNAVACIIGTHNSAENNVILTINAATGQFTMAPASGNFGGTLNVQGLQTVQWPCGTPV